MAKRRRAKSARRNVNVVKRKLGAMVATKSVARAECGCFGTGYHAIFMGILVFLVGLLLHYEWKWSAILMLAGVVIFIKGLIVAASNR